MDRPEKKPSFRSARIDLAEYMRKASQDLEHKEVSYRWVSRLLTECADEFFDVTEMVAERSTPLCFDIRADSILREMRAQSLIFKVGRDIMPDASKLIYYYALAIGRLTLHFKGPTGDKYAEDCDEDAMETKVSPMPKYSADGGRHARASFDLEALWLRLEWPVQICNCPQCARRKFLLRPNSHSKNQADIQPDIPNHGLGIFYNL